MQNNPLISKVALITGAARRVGAEITRVLHAEGMNVIIHYNQSKDAALKLNTELNQIRENSAVALQANLGGLASEEELLQKAGAIWGRLDALVNNASRFYKTKMGKITESAWSDLMDSNVKAPFFLAQAAAPFLAATQGVIVNITDIHAERSLRDYGVYCVSKSALWMGTKVLAKELAPNIRVNAVAPGPVIWPEGENTLSKDEQAKLIAKTALKQLGNPQDVAKAVLYFIRDASSVTGQMIAIDSGRTLSD